MVELHFDPDKYIVATPPSSSSSHDAQEILITRKRDDDMDYFSLLRGLESGGLRAWRWQPNGPYCLEMSYINTNKFSRQPLLTVQASKSASLSVTPIRPAPGLAELQFAIRVTPSVCKSEPIRLGSVGDGGWTVCDTFWPALNEQQQQRLESGADADDATCLVYSYGILHDYSFDEACEARGCYVYGFDPSVQVRT